MYPLQCKQQFLVIRLIASLLHTALIKFTIGLSLNSIFLYSLNAFQCFCALILSVLLKPGNRRQCAFGGRSQILLIAIFQLVTILFIRGSFRFHTSQPYICVQYVLNNLLCASLHNFEIIGSANEFSLFSPDVLTI